MENTDHPLIHRCLANDSGAFEELLNRNKNQIFSFIFRLIRNPEDAEDLAQDTFIKALRGLNSYDTSRPFITWLFAIAHNTCVDFLRAKKPQMLSIDDENTPDIADSPDSTRKTVELKLQQEETEELLTSLPPLYSEVLLLQFREDLPIQQIAEILQLPEGTVKIRLFRAKALIRKKIELLKNR
ncbi:MAG TPA: RNA polymerase sigma factor SigW [Elusimicrobia bacterium]|nr:RNA polymerase sigma factor SigW [Elusimicrobiota bacterium]